MYCPHSNAATEPIAAFLDIPLKSLPEGRRAAEERASVTNLRQNPALVGQSWTDAETAPGLHRRKLQAETYD